MSDQPQDQQQDPKDSQIFGVSLRGWLAVMLVATVCIMHLISLGAILYAGLKGGALPDLSGQVVGEPLYSMGMTALGFYLGQKTRSV